MGNLAGASDYPMGWSKYNPESMDEMGTQDGNVKKMGELRCSFGYDLVVDLDGLSDIHG